MISYKLAKQLKEAGFPQEKWVAKGKGEFEIRKDETTYIPTLSELIEACGEDFSGLTYFCGRKQHKWEAESCCKADEEWIIVEAESKGVAVAKLWLKLNRP